MLKLWVPEVLAQLSPFYKIYRCPRCGETHQNIYQWAACRWWRYHR